MDRSLVLFVALALFCVRDARLLASRRRLLIAYASLLLVTGGACGLVAENLSATQALELLGDARFLAAAIALHALLGYLSAWRSRSGRPADWISVLPTPVSCVAATGAVRFALMHLDGVSGPVVGVPLGLSYGLVAALLSLRIGARPDSSGALRFSALTHGSALLLVPASATLDNPLATQPVDWLTTGLLLASVAALIAGSFAWHRLRQR